MDRAPFAASAGKPGPEPDRAGTFDLADAEDPMRFSLSDADAAALEARRAATVERPAPLAGEARAAPIRECLEACESHRGIHGAATLFIEKLGELLHCTPEEAEALVSAEAAMRRGGG